MQSFRECCGNKRAHRPLKLVQWQRTLALCVQTYLFNVEVRLPTGSGDRTLSLTTTEQTGGTLFARRCDKLTIPIELLKLLKTRYYIVRNYRRVH